MRFLGKTKVLTALAMGLFGFSAAQAQPVSLLEITDGVNLLTSTDNSFGDDNPVLGAVTLSGAVGDFNVNVATGLSTPLSGSAELPKLDLSSVNLSGTGTGTLTIRFTTNNLTGPLPLGTSFLSAGGTTNGSVSVASYVDASNTIFGTATPTGSLTSGGSGDFSGNSTVSNIPLSGPYSATIIVTLTHDDIGDVSNFGAEYTIVPEPSSLALLGLGGLALMRRRRA